MRGSGIRRSLAVSAAMSAVMLAHSSRNVGTIATTPQEPMPEAPLPDGVTRNWICDVGKKNTTRKMCLGGNHYFFGKRTRDYCAVCEPRVKARLRAIKEMK